MLPSTGISPKAMDILNSLVRGTFALTLQRGLGALQVLLGTRKVRHGKCTSALLPHARCAMPGNTETVPDSALRFKGSSHSRLKAQKESLPPGVVVKCCSVRIMEGAECAPEIKLSLFKGAIMRQVLRAGALGRPRGMGWDGIGDRDGEHM